MAKIIDGKAVSQFVKDEVKKEVSALGEKGVSVGLAVIIVGNDPASRTYVNNKKKACEATGIISEEYALPEDTTMEELLALIKELNAKKSINGILCQLPLPKHLDEKAVIENIDPIKDVDAFHAVNTGHIMIGDYSFLPCTPAGIMEMARIKGGMNAKKKHNRTLKLAKGYRGARSKQYRVAKQSVMRALTSAYAGRKQKKRQFRQLWIARINAAARMNGLSYSKLMHGLKVANIDINRKMLAEMAVNDAAGFAALAEIAKKAVA